MRSYDAGTNGYDSIMRGYDSITRDYNSITNGYDSITRSYRRERERVRTIGLDWLLGVLLIGWRGLGRKAAG